MFHEPGTATGRAVDLIREMLSMNALGAQPIRSADPQPLRGGLS
jgi:hypothetical protein